MTNVLIQWRHLGILAFERLSGDEFISVDIRLQVVPCIGNEQPLERPNVPILPSGCVIRAGSGLKAHTGCFSHLVGYHADIT